MACAWIAWNVVWNVPLWGPRFTQPRRFQGLPVWAMRAEPTNASQQTDAMPHRLLDWFVMSGSRCFCLRDKGRGVWNIRIIASLQIVGFEEDFDGCGCGCCDSWGWPWLQQLNQLNQLSLCSRLPGGHVFELRARLLFFGRELRQMPRSIWSQCNPDLHCTCPCTGPCAWCSRLAMGAEACSNPATSKGFKRIDRTSEGSSAALVATLWLGDDFHFSWGRGIQFVVSLRLLPLYFFQVKIFSFHLQVNWRRSALGGSGCVGGQNGWEELWKIAILGASLCPDHPIFSLKPEGCLQFAVSLWSSGPTFLNKEEPFTTFYNMGIPETTSRLMGHSACLHVLQMLVLESLCFKETRSQTKQDQLSQHMEPRSDFFCAISLSLSLSHLLRMVPLCALSPPWWRQCFHWLSSSVACWWKSQSLDWASLVGCRTRDVRLVGWMKVGENLWMKLGLC